MIATLATLLSPATAPRLALSTAMAAGLLLAGCVTEDADALATPTPGGATTHANRTSSALEDPAPNLNYEEFMRHLESDAVFAQTFVPAPAEEPQPPLGGDVGNRPGRRRGDAGAGLGPVYNNTSCSGCHVRNGRGLPVVGVGSLGSTALVRVSIAEGDPDLPGGPVPAPGLGTQVQDQAVFGAEHEAHVAIVWTEEAYTFPSDGEAYILRKPTPVITMPDGTPVAGDVMMSLRIAPPVFGLGLLEAVPSETLEALADPEDVDGDGISGRVNRVWDADSEQFAVSRFGWKANVPGLTQQAAAAFFDSMGITNPIFPGDDLDPDPDIDIETVDLAAFYTRTLGVPGRGAFADPDVRRGEALFGEIGCESCHVSELQTGRHETAAVANQTISPYTDLLVHNMGMGLADGRPDFEASGTEWRTAPLWGIGVTETVLGARAFLHDGRARNLAEAILWHGGEAEASKEAFRTMSGADRRALLRFLGSL